MWQLTRRILSRRSMGCLTSCSSLRATEKSRRGSGLMPLATRIPTAFISTIFAISGLTGTGWCRHSTTTCPLISLPSSSLAGIYCPRRLWTRKWPPASTVACQRRVRGGRSRMRSMRCMPLTGRALPLVSGRGLRWPVPSATIINLMPFRRRSFIRSRHFSAIPRCRHLTVITVNMRQVCLLHARLTGPVMMRLTRKSRHYKRQISRPRENVIKSGRPSIRLGLPS